MQQLANCYRLLKTLACANLLAMCTHFFFFFLHTTSSINHTIHVTVYLLLYIPAHSWCGSRTVDKNHADTSHELQVMFTSNI